MNTASTNLDDLSAKIIPPCEPSGARRFLRFLATAAITLAGIMVIVFASQPAKKDYMAYWSAGTLILHRGNPYSPDAVLALENAHRAMLPKPLVMRNPPWSLFLALPLGLLGPLPGLLLWLLVGVFCIFISALLLDVPPKDRLLVFLFAPALACIATGQSSPYLLLGFTLFLYFYRSRPFVAGLCLLLMAIKPHLFVVFWMLFLIDCIRRRRLLALSGFASALTAGTAIAMYLDPQVWPQYLAMYRAAGLDHEFVPTLSLLLRVLIDKKADWIQFIPSSVAVMWGVWYYRRHRWVWDWRTHGMIVILVSILTSPYSWFTDEIVLLPCIVFALNFGRNQKHSVSGLLIINGVLMLMLLLIRVPLTSGAYLWTPLAWTTWFLYTTKMKAPVE